jgi:hypothetical protein
MLFSIPDSDWWSIAVAATGFFMLGIRGLPVGIKLPDDVHDATEADLDRGWWKLYVLTPAFAAVVLVVSRLRPGPAPVILFLYSAMFVAIPVALFPVRGRILRDYVLQRRNPGVPIRPDRLAMAWIIGVLSVACLAAVAALMTTPYGRRG